MSRKGHWHEYLVALIALNLREQLTGTRIKLEHDEDMNSTVFIIEDILATGKTISFEISKIREIESEKE